MFNTEVLVNKIREWEFKAGESFTDYFMHDSVPAEIWLDFLKSKGFVERAEVLENIFKNKKYLDQEQLFHPNLCYLDEDFNAIERVEYSTETHIEYMYSYILDVYLWAEFILSDEDYVSWVKELFNQYNIEY